MILSKKSILWQSLPGNVILNDWRQNNVGNRSGTKSTTYQANRKKTAPFERANDPKFCQSIVEVLKRCPDEVSPENFVKKEQKSRKFAPLFREIGSLQRWLDKPQKIMCKRQIERYENASNWQTKDEFTRKMWIFEEESDFWDKEIELTAS